MIKKRIKYDYYIKKYDATRQYTEHKKIRLLLLKLMSIGSGAALNPRAISKYIYNYLEQKNPNSRNNVEHARNYAYVFACLCDKFNHSIEMQLRKYMLTKQHALIKNALVDESFYMSGSEWKRNMIGGTLRYKAPKILAEIGLISLHQKTFSTKPFKRDIFCINIKKLYEIFDSLKARPQVKTQEEIVNEWLEFERELEIEAANDKKYTEWKKWLYRYDYLAKSEYDEENCENNVYEESEEIRAYKRHIQRALSEKDRLLSEEKKRVDIYTSKYGALETQSIQWDDDEIW